MNPVLLTPPNDTQENNANIRPPIPLQSLLPSQSRISLPVTIITAIILSKQPIFSSTSSELLLVVSRASQNPDGNSPGIIAAYSAAVTRSFNLGLSRTPSIQSRDQAGYITGLTEQQVKR